MDGLRRITSPANALLKQLRRGFALGEADEPSLMAIEGVRMMEEALRSGLKARAVFFREPVNAVAARVMEQVGRKAEAVSLPREIFDRAVATESPQGVAALVEARTSTWQEILSAQDAMILALGGVQDPGNVGTLLRTAEAFSAAGVLLLEGTVDAYNPKVVRAAAGSLFRLPVMKAKFAEARARLREKGFRVLAASSHQGTPVAEAQLRRPLCLLIGNEGAGLSREMTAAADELVRIPHSAKVESLNAAVAGAVMMYEAARDKLTH